MEGYDDFDQPTAVTPEVVDPPATTDVSKNIERSLTTMLEKVINKKYNTKVSVTPGGDQMTLNVNIQTNDPRVIAALCSSEGVLK